MYPPLSSARRFYNRGSAAAALCLERRGAHRELAYAASRYPSDDQLSTMSDEDAFTAGCRDRLIACGLDPAAHIDEALGLIPVRNVD